MDNKVWTKASFLIPVFTLDGYNVIFDRSCFYGKPNVYPGLILNDHIVTTDARRLYDPAPSHRLVRGGVNSLTPRFIHLMEPQASISQYNVDSYSITRFSELGPK